MHLRLGLGTSPRERSSTGSGVSLSAGGPAVAASAPAAMLLLRLAPARPTHEKIKTKKNQADKSTEMEDQSQEGKRARMPGCAITFSLTWNTTFQIATFNHNDCYYFYFSVLFDAPRSSKVPSKMIFIMPTARGECKMPGHKRKVLKVQ